MRDPDYCALLKLIAAEDSQCFEFSSMPFINARRQLILQNNMAVGEYSINTLRVMLCSTAHGFYEHQLTALRCFYEY